MRGRVTDASRYVKLLGFGSLIGLIVGGAVLILQALYAALWGLTEEALSISRLLVFALPVTGMIASVTLVRAFALDKSTGSGTHKVLEVYHFKGGVLPLRDALSKSTASALTIGLGGSAGLEGPSLLLGGGLTSALAWRLRFNAEEARVWFLSGAAAGLSAVFKAPLTGIMFALEVPFKRDLAKEAFVPATVSSVASYLLVVAYTGPEVLFPTTTATPPLTVVVVLHSAVVGFAAAAVGVAFIKFYEWCGSIARMGVENPYLRALLGGLLVAAIGFILPGTLGLGYQGIMGFASGEVNALDLLLALLAAKIVATSITLNTGGSGGLFIPSIFVGAALGAAYSTVFLGGSNPVIVGAAVAAMLAATSKTLLTGVAFAAEAIGSSSVMVALIASVTSYFASGSYSFYAKMQPHRRPVEEEEDLSVLLHELVGKGRLPMLSAIKVSDVMSKPVALQAGMTVGEALDVARRHAFRVYPVIGDRRELIGYISVEDLFLASEEGRDKPLRDITLREPLVAFESDSLANVAEKMVEAGAGHVYIVSDRESMVLAGVVSRIDVIRKLIELG